jgi:hypothetical protein
MTRRVGVGYERVAMRNQQRVGNELRVKEVVSESTYMTLTRLTAAWGVSRYV